MKTIVAKVVLSHPFGHHDGIHIYKAKSYAIDTESISLFIIVKVMYTRLFNIY